MSADEHFDSPGEYEDDYPFTGAESACTDLDAAMALLSQLPEILVVPCEKCDGHGNRGASLGYLQCDKCEGCGKTTAHATRQRND